MVDVNVMQPQNDLPGPTRHPFIEGLLQTLPEPHTDWPAQDRAKWLQTAANIFDLIYKGEGGGVTSTGELCQARERPMTETLTWAPNEYGCEAKAPNGMLFIKPASEKSVAGVTMFDLTWVRDEAADPRHVRDVHRRFGTFESPALAKLMAEAVILDGRA
jgi:hypothetical protein